MAVSYTHLDVYKRQDYQKLESFKNDPTIFEAVEQLHQELEDMSQDQGMTM